MIKTRIASTAALFTFGVAALGGTVVAIAAPANAAPSASGSSSTSPGIEQHNGTTLRDQHEQSKTNPNKFNAPPITGPSSASTPALGSDQTAGPAVPRTWYPEMPHQGG